MVGDLGIEPRFSRLMRCFKMLFHCYNEHMQGLEELWEVIDSAESDLLAELQRSNNSWLACYVSRLVVLQTTLALSPHRKDSRLHGRIDKLLIKKEEVRKQYGWDPPQNIRDELMKGIKSLLDA